MSSCEIILILLFSCWPKLKIFNSTWTSAPCLPSAFVLVVSTWRSWFSRGNSWLSIRYATNEIAGFASAVRKGQRTAHMRCIGVLCDQWNLTGDKRFRALLGDFIIAPNGIFCIRARSHLRDEDIFHAWEVFNLSGEQKWL